MRVSVYATPLVSSETTIQQQLSKQIQQVRRWLHPHIFFQRCIEKSSFDIEGTSEQAVDSDEGHEDSKSDQLSNRRERLMVVDTMDHIETATTHT